MRSKEILFKGTATALATPFKNGKIDYDALGRILEMQMKAKIPAIVLCGTTGEAPTLDDDERNEYILKSMEIIGGRAKVIIGTGSLNPKRAIEQSRFAASHGADGLLVITPFYNKGTKSGIAEYYKRISDEAKCPIIIYNVPSRTGVDITLDTLAQIYDDENIVGIKEASGSIDKALDISTYFPEISLYSGNDSMTIPIMSLGGMGVISVASNILPHKMQEMCIAFLNGETARALEIQRSLTAIMHLLFSDVNPSPVKAALEILGLCENELRLPLTPVSAELYSKIKNAIADLF